MTTFTTGHNDLIIYSNFGILYKLDIIDTVDMSNIYDWCANGEDCD